MHPFDLNPVVVFHGDLSPNLAHVYVQLPGPRASDLQLRGQVRGPRSLLTRTLPASIRLTDLGPGPSTLARALIPDPCFWAPGHPFLYDVEVELWRGREVVRSLCQTLGLRRLGMQGGQLLLESHPWVLLGCHDTSVDASPWDVWRELQVARVVLDPSEELCQQASEEGVVLIAQVAASSSAARDREIARLGKWAAVVLIEILSPAPSTSHVRAVAPNCMFAQSVSQPGDGALAEWADLEIREVPAAGPSLSPIATATMPWIARRRLPLPVPLTQAAQACRDWHAAWAPDGSCLGCFV
ncbi:MAG: hypothetical protein ACYC4U_33245 [Pirellulaceae bacterium]